MKRIILASGSPRRKQLLKQIGLDYEIIPSDIEEVLNPRLKPRRQAEVLSLEKAMAVLPKIKNGVIIAADTLVALGDEILVKPKDIGDAEKMIKKLSGKCHSVFTGFTIIDASSKKTITDSVETKVWFRKLSGKEIKNYIAKEKPFDNAGSYRIQGYGSLIVEKIEGDYFNVVGLPIFSLTKILKKFGVNIL